CEAETRRSAAAVGDERRHGGEMIGIGCMAEAEDNRYGDDHEERGAVREVNEPRVEAEHQTHTFPTARTTMPTPARTITAALTAGRTAARRPRPSKRANTPLASTATSPTAVIASASPKLNAPTSASPKPTRWSEIAASRTTSAEGQGRRPPETPTASRLRRSCACSWSWPCSW